MSYSSAFEPYVLHLHHYDDKYCKSNVPQKVRKVNNIPEILIPKLEEEVKQEIKEVVKEVIVKRTDEIPLLKVIDNISIVCAFKKTNYREIVFSFDGKLYKWQEIEGKIILNSTLGPVDSEHLIKAITRIKVDFLDL